MHPVRDDALVGFSELAGAGKDATLVEYKNAGHYFYGPWGDTIRRVDQFLGKHLGA